MVKQSVVNKFLEAASHGDVQRIKELHRQQGDEILDRKGSYENGTALQFACSLGNIDVVRYLVEHGADVNIKDGYGDTAMFYALRKGKREIAEFLFEKGEIDLHDSENFQCNKYLAHIVCHGGYVECLQFLVDHGTEVTQSNLYIACLLGNLSIVQYLFSSPMTSSSESRPFFQINSIVGENSLRVASCKGHLHIIQYLVEQHEGDTVNINGKGSYVDWGSWNNNMEDWNQSYHRLSSLSIACNRGHFRTVQYLIHHGANVNDREQDDDDYENDGGIADETKPSMALRMAVKGNKLLIVEFLVENATANVPPGEGPKLLNIASLAGNVPMMRLLLQNFPSMDIWACETNKHGLNPLMVASQEGNMNVIEYLCTEARITAQVETQLSACLNIKSHDNRTALEFASANGHTHIVRYLHKDGGQATIEALQSAVVGGYADIVTYICEETDVDIVSSTDVLTGRTLLHTATEIGWARIVHYFINKCQDDTNGIDINAQYKATGWKSLHEATKNSKFEIFFDLISARANPNLQDETGATPLHVAVEHDMSYIAPHRAANADVYSRTKCLLELDANPLASNAKGDTPLSLAIKGSLDGTSMLGEEDELSLVYQLLRSGGFLILDQRR